MSVNDFMNGSRQMHSTRKSVVSGLRGECECGGECIVNEDGHPRPEFEYAGRNDPLTGLDALGRDDEVALSRAQPHEPLLDNERSSSIRASLTLFDHKDGVAEWSVEHRGCRDKQQSFRSCDNH